MKFRHYYLIVLVTVFSGNARAAMEEPLIVQIKADEFETSDSSDQSLTWDGQAWFGKTLRRFWLKSEGERVHGETEAFELQALYSNAVSTYWDFQAGIRHDFEPSPQLDWAVLGLQGLAPYFFEIETALFLSEEGDLALRLKAEYDLLLTQRLILTPEFEVNLYQDDMPDQALGSGLADIDAGLRLRYEIRREFAPYIGINWHEKFNKTADFASLRGEEVSDTSVIVGLRFWF